MVADITAGHHAIVYVSGTAATLTTEATDADATHKIYQIHTAAKRVLDPTYAVTHSTMSGVVTVNRLTGTLTSTVDETANEPITVSGKYLPLSQLLYADDFSIVPKPIVEDKTPFYTTDVVKDYTLRDVGGTIGTFFDPAEVAGLTLPSYFETVITNDTIFVIKFKISANWEIIAWARLDTDALRVVIKGHTKQTLTWIGTPDVDGREMV